MHNWLIFKIQKSNADSKLSDFSSESNSDEHTTIYTHIQTQRHTHTHTQTHNYTQTHKHTFNHLHLSSLHVGCSHIRLVRSWFQHRFQIFCFVSYRARRVKEFDLNTTFCFFHHIFFIDIMRRISVSDWFHRHSHYLWRRYLCFQGQSHFSSLGY